MLIDYRPRFLVALRAEAQAQGRRLTHEEILAVCSRLANQLVDEASRTAKKERARAQIDPQAHAILNVYPRREGGEAALVSITKAIAKDGFDAVLERTSEYAQAVARWPHNRRRSASGSSLIPLPTTFFNNRRYLDDSAQWWEGTGGKSAASKPEQLPEPEGWRFHHPDSRYVRDHEPWERIDLLTQRWIIDNTPKLEKRA